MVYLDYLGDSKMTELKEHEECCYRCEHSLLNKHTSKLENYLICMEDSSKYVMPQNYCEKFECDE